MNFVDINNILGGALAPALRPEPGHEGHNNGGVWQAPFKAPAGAEPKGLGPAASGRKRRRYYAPRIARPLF